MFIFSSSNTQICKFSFPIFGTLMNERRKHIIAQMNRWGTDGNPFVFLIDFEFEKPLLFSPDDDSKLLWQTPEKQNFRNVAKEELPVTWDMYPASFDRYKKAFRKVQQHIHDGDTYLLNLTMPSKVKTNLSPEEIFHRSQAPYKIWLKNEFVCFSPEIFVRINEGIISSYPMKGTIDATLENAATLLLTDKKEVAEHHTMVDLIRNDLSMVASNVKVDRLMYLDRITTNRGELYQMSSRISGRLPENYPAKIGDIMDRLLPAGSICGAPKPKTLKIIKETECYGRNYYTGVFGIFDGRNLDSCVLIRFLEQDGADLIFKSGGGITFLSDCETEYNELIQKIYVPIG